MVERLSPGLGLVAIGTQAVLSLCNCESPEGIVAMVGKYVAEVHLHDPYHNVSRDKPNVNRSM